LAAWCLWDSSATMAAKISMRLFIVSAGRPVGLNLSQREDTMTVAWRDQDSRVSARTRSVDARPIRVDDDLIKVAHGTIPFSLN
jgi:hypothetical protein